MFVDVFCFDRLLVFFSSFSPLWLLLLFAVTFSSNNTKTSHLQFTDYHKIAVKCFSVVCVVFDSFSLLVLVVLVFLL